MCLKCQSKFHRHDLLFFAMPDRLKLGRAGLLLRVSSAMLLVVMTCSCQRSEFVVQVDEAREVLKELQSRLELLRKEQGRSGAPTALPASQNWHLQELQKRLAEGKTLEASLAGQKAELERMLKEHEAVRANYLSQHGGSKS